MIDFFNTLFGRIIFIIARIRIQIDNDFSQNYICVANLLDLTIESKKSLPSKLIQSIICIEDRRYFRHLGVDLLSISRAIYRNIFHHKLEGASTIEQQLVRSSTNNRSLKLSRKIDEILLAVIISRKYDKHHIISAYLHSYQFGENIGVNALILSEKIDLDILTDFEAASIAARLKYPNTNRRNYVRYLKRVRTIEIKTTPNIS